MNIIKSEERTLQRIAKEYRIKGYEVEIHPVKPPTILGRFRPDMIAKNRSETVVVEVKTRSDLMRSELFDLSTLVERQPGWRFELVITNPKLNISVPDEAEMPSIEDIKSRLTQAKSLIKLDQTEAALVLIWSAIEGLLRLIAQNQGVQARNRTALYLIKKLYSEGILDKNTFLLFEQTAKIRNSVVHGLSLPKIDTNLLNQLVESAQQLRINTQKMVNK